jgi:signal transduction histidine kinase
MMPSILRIAAWPLAVKIPVLVAGLMVSVAAVTSQVVLWQFVEDQKSNLLLLSKAYLDSVSAAILPAVVREDVWEAFDALERMRNRHAGFEPRFTIIEMPGGKILASSDPLRFPVHSATPEELRSRFGTNDDVHVDVAAGRAWLATTLRADGFSVGHILAEIDIADLLHARREILLSLVLVNGCLTLTFALGGYLLMTRMLRPLGILTRYVEQIRDGRVEPIPERFCTKIASEFGQLFDRFNEMARVFSERTTLAAQLAEQEKHKMLGRLASGIAHEVNNPLGGMENAIDAILAHGNDPAVLKTSVDFLKRGLAGIREVVRAALATYKGSLDTRVLTPSDLDDLPRLVQHEIRARQLRLDWHNYISVSLGIDGFAVRQITLNLLLNACMASPLSGKVNISASCINGMLQIAVADEGPGLPEGMATLLNQDIPEATRARETKGLGLWMTGHLIRRLGGHADVEYPGIGTRVIVSLPIVQKELLSAA